MFGSSWPPVVCRRAHILFTYLCLFAYSGVQSILCCVFVLFFFVLCTLCCQFLWIVNFYLPLRYSLTFILCVVFCRLFVLLSFFFWPLCCLSYFNAWVLITSLVSSKSSLNICISSRLILSGYNLVSISYRDAVIIQLISAIEELKLPLCTYYSSSLPTLSNSWHISDKFVFYKLAC